MQNNRTSVLSTVRRVVIKVGSQLLTRRGGGLDPYAVRRIATQIAELRGRGLDVTLVSSGAISTGMGALKLRQRPHDVAALQAVAATGQVGLMQKWHTVFNKLDIEVAQILLTRSDFEHRQRYLNARNCIHALHELQALPIVNENDTVSVDEIRVGDNDILAALLCNALPADLLILLTVADGLLDETGKVIHEVTNVAEVEKHVMQGTSAMGTGGMGTKLQAARMVTDAGEVAIVANGREKQVLTRLLDGEELGTLFRPAARKLASRRRWIGQAVRPTGVIVVDDGAATALVTNGRSLLPRGVTEVAGVFEKGDVVVVRDQRGRELARGLINYDNYEARAIMGKKSSEIEAVLKRVAYDELIHRDNMTVTAGEANGVVA